MFAPYGRPSRTGTSESKDRRTSSKQAYSFPDGDFDRVHRSGVISGESRASPYDHDEIEREVKKLLDLIDADES